MSELTKDDFSCWGNGDKYDDELIITHDPKIHSRTIADQILKNQDDAKVLPEAEKCRDYWFDKFTKLDERLKKRIEEIHTFKSVRDETELKKELQKILEGKK